jgi:hypothetical protein
MRLMRSCWCFDVLLACFLDDLALFAVFLTSGVELGVPSPVEGIVTLGPGVFFAPANVVAGLG